MATGNERRENDRRDSPRIPIRLEVRSGTGEYLPADGDISVGGAYVALAEKPSAESVALRFELPGVDRMIEARGEIVRISETGDRFGVHLRFTDISLDDELAVARFIDRHLLQAS